MSVKFFVEESPWGNAGLFGNCVTPWKALKKTGATIRVDGLAGAHSVLTAKKAPSPHCQPADEKTAAGKPALYESLMVDQQFLSTLADAVADRVVLQLASQSSPKRRLMTVPEAAEYIGRTRQATYHLIHQGKIPTKHQGSRVFIDRIELDKWIDSLGE